MHRPNRESKKSTEYWDRGANPASAACGLSVWLHYVYCLLDNHQTSFTHHYQAASNEHALYCTTRGDLS